MKQWIAALLLMLIPGVQAAKPQKVTLMVDDVPVAQVLQALAEQEKLNLVVSPDVSGTVSLHLTDVPWKQALQTVVKSAGLITRQEGNILSVHSIAWQNNNIARQEAEQARAQEQRPSSGGFLSGLFGGGGSSRGSDPIPGAEQYGRPQASAQPQYTPPPQQNYAPQAAARGGGFMAGAANGRWRGRRRGAGQYADQYVQRLAPAGDSQYHRREAAA